MVAFSVRHRVCLFVWDNQNKSCMLGQPKYWLWLSAGQPSNTSIILAIAMNRDKVKLPPWFNNRSLYWHTFCMHFITDNIIFCVTLNGHVICTDSWNCGEQANISDRLSSGQQRFFAHVTCWLHLHLYYSESRNFKWKCLLIHFRIHTFFLEDFSKIFHSECMNFKWSCTDCRFSFFFLFKWMNSHSIKQLQVGFFFLVDTYSLCLHNMLSTCGSRAACGPRQTIKIEYIQPLLLSPLWKTDPCLLLTCDTSGDSTDSVQPSAD